MFHNQNGSLPPALDDFFQTLKLLNTAIAIFTIIARWLWKRRGRSDGKQEGDHPENYEL